MTNRETVQKEYVILVDSMGDDLRVVNSARVSFNKESEWDRDNPIFGEDEQGQFVEYPLKQADEKLINYLAKHGHWTPFSHVMVTLRIKMPIFIARQWFKHTIGFTRNESSRRYIDAPPEFWAVEEWRGAPINKKQGSSGVVDLTSTNDEDSLLDCVNNLAWDSAEVYESLIKEGVAAEQARTLLPQTMLTEFYETASLAAYARLVKLRDSADAQLETKWYAEAVDNIMQELCPTSWAALMEN